MQCHHLNNSACASIPAISSTILKKCAGCVFQILWTLPLMPMQAYPGQQVQSNCVVVVVEITKWSLVQQGYVEPASGHSTNDLPTSYSVRPNTVNNNQTVCQTCAMLMGFHGQKAIKMFQC